MEYAIVETGGKQYKVAQGDTILVEKLSAEVGSSLKLEKVLFMHDGKKVRIGTPYLPGSKVHCEVLGQTRGRKVISFKFQRRKGYRKKIGHRQSLTQLKIKEFITASK